MALWSLAVVLALLIVSTLATQGVDVSQYTSKDAFACLKSQGFTFAVVRGYQSVNRVDPNVGASVANAWASGMSHVDVYMFPCPTCGDPAGQMAKLVSYLNSNGVKYGMIWLDIEGPGYWSSSCSENQQFAGVLANTAVSMGVHLGVYTSASQWNPIMCGWTGLSQYPLWYAHYDINPSFSDFAPFGGWTKPNIKQYKGTTALCGASVDLNWYP